MGSPEAQSKRTSQTHYETNTQNRGSWLSGVYPVVVTWYSSTDPFRYLSPPWVQLTDVSTIRTVLIIVLILFLIGAFPAWPYSSGWGYYPAGGIGLVLLILIVLALAGQM
jgi:hypothetical protein